MSIIKKLDDISGVSTRSKTISEAIERVAEEMDKLRGSKKTAKSKTEKEKPENTEEA